MDIQKSTYAKYNKIGDSDFSWQEDCSNSIRNQPNVILSSPTGSGKTRVFLEWAKNHEKKPVIITAPIKALSNQRYRELLDAGYKVGLETGDIKNVPNNCDFICCTQEIYTNKYIELEDVTLIMDEFHYIFENPNRTRTYIDALHNSKAKNILLCSATLGDINELTEYVNRVSERDFFTYENDSRLTSLFFEGDIDFIDIQNSLIVTFSQNNIKEILEMLYETRELQDEKTLETIDKLAEKNKIYNHKIIANAQKGLSGYYSALLPKEKLFIEKCFEQGIIDTVVGTDALALGVNFPVENVIFAQLTKYYDGPISKNLFDQLSGRAGRKGFFDEGHVYYCTDFANFCEPNYIQDVFEVILEQPNEDVSIVLTPNIRDLLLDKTTILKEVEYVSEFSTVEVDSDKLYTYLLNTIDYINNKAFENEVERLIDEIDENEKIKWIKNNYLVKKDEFSQNIARIYFDEYSVQKNCQIFTEILCGIAPEKILQKYGMSGNFYDMLQFRKYVHSLPQKYRKGLTKINDKIREIDETAIDRFRGSVSIEEISDDLEQQGKLDGKSVMQVLKEQESMQRMSERIGIIDKQLKIAEEYGLEDY